MTPDPWANLRGVPREPRPWPLAPLLTRLGVETLTELAEKCDTNRSVLNRCAERGLTDRQADAFAIAAGFHPIEVWPTWCAIDDERTA